MLVRYLDTIGPSVMNVICVVLPIVGFIIGFMKGFVNRSVRILEGAIIIFLALVLKNPISALLYKFVPFLGFKYKVLNVLLFELLGFALIAFILIIIVHILNKFINIVERIVGVIMQIGVPTSILGALVSFVEFVFYLYVFIFIVFFFSAITNSPIEASLANKFYYNMPVLRPLLGDSFDACIEVGEEVNSGESADKINANSMKILLYSHFISYDNAKYIIDNNKIEFSGSDKLLENYK